MYFMTGNANKFKEAQEILGPQLKQLDLDLPEIQSLNPREIIEVKLREAVHHSGGEIIVDDTSLVLDCLNGLPGPLIKWFLEAKGPRGIYEIAEKFKNTRAKAIAMIGYARSESEICFFEGIVEGEVVPPRGKRGFGWDPIFKPDGHGETYAEMDDRLKNSISHRRLALNKLREFLDGR